MVRRKHLLDALYYKFESCPDLYFKEPKDEAPFLINKKKENHMKKIIKGFQQFVNESLSPEEQDELERMGLGDKKNRAIEILQDLFAELGLPTELEDGFESNEDPEIGDYFAWHAFGEALDPIMISINDEGKVGFSWDSSPLRVSAHSDEDIRLMSLSVYEESIPVPVRAVTKDDVYSIWKEINDKWGPGSDEYLT